MGEVTFQRPPLIEVSFGIRFSRPPELHSGHFGLFWSRLKNEFPETSDQIPIMDLGQQIQFAVDRLVPRVWLIHKEKALLIQLQTDRFYFNWRRLQPTASYPRFSTLLPEFQRYVTMWNDFLDQQGLGSFEPSVCELSYINHLALPGGWNDLWEAGKMMVSLVPSKPSNAMPLRAVNWAAIYDKPSSRMTLNLQTAENATDRTEKILQLEIKAESNIPISSIAAMVDWLPMANLDIVESFTLVTTEFAQAEVWGRVRS